MKTSGANQYLAAVEMYKLFRLPDISFCLYLFSLNRRGGAEGNRTQEGGRVMERGRGRERGREGERWRERENTDAATKGQKRWRNLG